MATKPIVPTPPAKRTESSTRIANDEALRKSIPFDGQVRTHDQKITTVFQTRPTPPDPGKK